MRRVSLIVLLSLLILSLLGLGAYAFCGLGNGSGGRDKSANGRDKSVPTVGQNTLPNGRDKSVPTVGQNTLAPTDYLYYTLKQSDGFVLARSPKGADGQPLDAPTVVAHFGNDFGLSTADSVLSMQLSPDGQYLAIDGTQDHGEMVWIFNTQSLAISTTPAWVMGNFLHWVPDATGHSFLYRPLFPLGPQAPMDGNSWNPGLWVVNAATGAHRNIDILVPSADLVDAAPSPDGSRIVYATTAGLGRGSDTWMMNIDGSQRTHLFSQDGGAQSIAGLFSWSPDGRSIVYERLSDSAVPFLPSGLWLMNSQGGAQQRLADADGGHGYAPVWSPDGQKIAFVQRTNTDNPVADTQAQALQTALEVVDLSKGATAPHISLVASVKDTGMQLNVNPIWASDSSRITFTAFDPINKDIGGAPHYWSASAESSGSLWQSTVIPTSPELTNVIAMM